MIARAASNDAALLGEVRMQLCQDADTLPVSLWLLDRGADMADRPTRSLHVDRADVQAPWFAASQGGGKCGHLDRFEIAADGHRHHDGHGQRPDEGRPVLGVIRWAGA